MVMPPSLTFDQQEKIAVWTKVEDGDDDEEDEAAAEIKAAMSEIMVVVGDMFSRMTFQVYFTEHGVEFPTTIELAE